MAQLNIERKGSSLWQWITGIGLLAIVVFVVMQYMHGHNDDQTANAPIDSTAVQTAPQYAPAAPPSSSDTIAGDSAKTDTIKGLTTSAQ
jgi:hypothetical protein